MGRLPWISNTLARAWRLVRGDAAKRPFVDAPLHVGNAHSSDNTEDTYPLSPLQHAMLVQSLQAQRLGIDIEQIVIELHEELNVAAFRRAWQHAAERHPMLRTVFRWEATDGPRQAVCRQITIPWIEADWRGLSAHERQTRWESCLLADRARCIDLSVEPGIRLTLAHEDANHFRFLWTFHHIVMDGRGIVALLGEVFESYEAICRGISPAADTVVPYRAFIDWQQQQDWSKAEAYWRNALRGFCSPTPLTVARTTPCELEPAQMRGEQRIELDAESTAALQGWAKDNQLTLNTLVQGAWALLLSRYSGAEDVVFGVIRACRHGTIPDAHRIVGMCINTVPMRVRVSSDRSLLAWFQELRQQWVALREVEHTPLVMIQGWSEVPRGTALFESLVNFQDPSWDAALRSRCQAWSERGLSIVSQPSLPLVLDGYGGARLKLILLYDRRRFDDATITRMLGHLRMLLQGIAANPNQKLEDLPRLTDGERRQQVDEWNQTTTDYPKQRSVHHLFEAQARATPKAIAVSFEATTLTYQELNRRANQLAHYLRALGVTRGALVGICVERSPEMIVGMLAILKAGGAYVPLDPSYPLERLAFMMADTRTSVLLTQERLRGSLPKTCADIVCIDSDWLRVSKESDLNLEGDNQGHDLAYVIYTSGSTGKPKGACIPHRGIVRLAVNTDYIQLGSRDRVAQASNSSFDAATFEIWGALLNGARLVIVRREVLLSPRNFADLLNEQRISTLFLTTALFNLMAREAPGVFRGLRTLLFGGEKVDPHWVRVVLGNGPPQRLLHVYGPTETTTFATWYHVRSVEENAVTVPIGRPIANTTIYVLDKQGEPVPLGVPGELHIGGDGVAHGYLHRPELTAENFVPDPFTAEPDSRLYRTGDLVRFLPDGNLEFMGRVDQQVKLRGFRIELGEIETMLQAHPAVRESVVIVREDTPGDRRLVAYVVLTQAAGGTIDRPRQFLKQKLPEYMVPSAIVVMDALPLSPNGKVDRRALPRPGRTKSETGPGFVPARTLTEEVAAGIWEDLLKVERVGVHDHFFELGGDSLLATMTAVRLQRSLQVDVPVSLLFDKPTLAALCECIDHLRSLKRGVERPPLSRVARDNPLPLSYFQERIWENCQTAADPLKYMTHMNLDLRGLVDAEVLRRSLTEVVRRHEVLRTSIGTHDGKPVQVIAPAADVPLSIIDLSHDPDLLRFEQEQERLPFDLARGPLMRASLVRLGIDHHRFALAMHHLIYDSSVREIFFRELGVLYAAFRRGEASPLPEPALQYADFAVWQRQCLKPDGAIYREQLAYWNQQLAAKTVVTRASHLGIKAVAPLRLPFERPRPAAQNLADAMHMSPWLPAELCKRLSTMSQREGATLFMTMLAGFKAWLYQHTRQEEMLMGTYVAARNRPELDQIIGLKTNLLALRTSLAGNPTFRELLHRVRATTLGAYAHQDLLFHQLEQAISNARGQTPTVQAIFQFVRLNEVPLSLPDVQVELLEPTLKSMPWGFSLNVMLWRDEKLICGLTFDADRYDPDAVRQMIPAYYALLARVADNPDLRLAELRNADIPAPYAA